MNLFKRAWLYIARKRGKSLVLLLTLFLIATSLLVAISVGKASKQAKQVFSDKSSYTLRIANNNTQLVGDGYGSGEIPEAAIKNLEGHPDIEKISNSIQAFSILTNHEIVRKGASKEEFKENNVTITGITYSELDSKFTVGMVRLVEGRHITKEDRYSVLVHETFAKVNKLKVGDTFLMSRDPIRNASNKEPVKVTIVGIYAGETAAKTDYPYEMIENFFFGDETLLKDLYGYQDGEVFYTETVVQLKKGAEADSLSQLIKEQKIDWSKYELTSKDISLQTYKKSIDILNDLSAYLLNGAILISIILLMLTLFSWVGDRTHEMGILLALGKSKLNIISQYALEVIIIAALAFSLSFFSGNFLGQKTGDMLVYQAAQSARADVTNSLNGMNLGADPETDLLLQAIKKIDVTISGQDMTRVFLVGGAIILISIAGSSLSVLRFKPKEILSKMS